MKFFRLVKEKLWLVLLVMIPLLFFYEVIFFFKIPFPGDILVGDYEPYRSYSFIGYNPGSYPHKAQGPDVVKQLIPWKKFSIDSFKNKEIPLWNPHNFSGNPLMANFQSGVFYPLNLIFLILPFQFAWSFYILLTPILATLFTFSYLRNLKLSQEASLVGAISFSFSLYMVAWMEYGNIGHTLLYLPLLLLIADKTIEKLDYKLFFSLVLVSTFSILAGYIQGFFYIFSLVSFYFIVKAISLKKLSVKKMFLFFLGLLLPVFISMFQVLPTLELFANSSRGNYSLENIEKLLNPAHYLITIFAPDFFGNPATRSFWFDGTYIERVSYFGLIPLLFALFAISRFRTRIEIKIFTICFLATLFLSTDFLITKFFYLLPIPVISTTVPTRILSLFAFSGSILAALGFDIFVNNKSNKRLLLLGLAGSVFLFSTLLFTSFYPRFNPDMLTNLLVGRKNLILPLGFSLIFTFLVFVYKKQKTFQKIIVYFFIFLVSLELFYYFQKITPFSPPQSLYPNTKVMDFIKEKDGVNRFWGYGSGYIEPNFQTFERTYSTEGVDPLHIKEYTELLTFAKEGKLATNLPRPDANIPNGYGLDGFKNNPFRQKLLNILGVKYVLQKDETRNSFEPDTATFPQESYKLVWQENPWQIYENLTRAPRIFLTNKYSVAKDKADALRIFYNEKFDEKKELVLYEDPKIDESVNLRSGLELINYTPNKITVETSSNANSLLFISDNYYPGWEVQVDGQNDKILVADYAFRAVSVPAGKHNIEFVYRPRSFYRGVWVSTLALLTFVSILIFMKIKKYEV